jgi:hypothetical protein
MSKQLYVQAYEEMVQKYPDEFARFLEVHDKFKQDQDTWKEKFDELGKPLVRIITDTENRLCSKMENSNRGKYSANLAEKFRAEVKSHFPLIDFVGVTIS